MILGPKGEVFGAANSITSNNDPTAHAEVQAIRLAGQRLETFDLSGCVLYSSCEPCPMCLGAALWARVDRIVYAADRHDAAAAGFDDAAFYALMANGGVAKQLSVPNFNEPFEAWKRNSSSPRVTTRSSMSTRESLCWRIRSGFSVMESSTTSTFGSMKTDEPISRRAGAL